MSMAISWSKAIPVIVISLVVVNILYLSSSRFIYSSSHGERGRVLQSFENIDLKDTDNQKPSQASKLLKTSTKAEKSKTAATQISITTKHHTTITDVFPRQHKAAQVNGANKYRDVCFLSTDKATCEDICSNDRLCYYSIYEKSLREQQCFLQLFFNETQPDCRRTASESAIIYEKPDEEIRERSEYDKPYLINTPTCKKVNHHPFDQSLVGKVSRSEIVKSYKCKGTWDHIVHINEKDELALKKPLQKGDKCSIRYVSRDEPSKTDDDYTKLDWIPFNYSHPIMMEKDYAELYCEKAKRTHFWSSKLTARDYISHVSYKLADMNHKKALNRKTLDDEHRRFSENISVVLFGLDSTSRNQALRQLPRTLGYLTNELGAISLDGYNRLQDNTFMNLYPLLTGINVTDGPGITWNRKFDDDPLLWKYFNKAGFVTAFYEDYKVGGLFAWLKKGFDRSPTDHYSRPFSCAVEDGYGGNQWSRDFCYLDKGVHVWVADWTRSFMKKYTEKKYPMFGFIWTTLLTHEYTNMLGQADEFYYKFLKDLKSDGSLDDPIFIFYSDHGYRYGDLRSTELGQYEENIPMFNIILPDWFKKKYPKETKNLISNARDRLTSPHDIHRTLLDLCPGCLKEAMKNEMKMKDYGKTLFDPLPEDRTCAQAGVPDHFCGCKTTSRVATTDPTVVKGANAIVEAVNRITDVEKKCLKYKVKSISYATRNVRHDIKDKATQEFTINISVTPSTALFSATVHVYTDERKPLVHGISRVSLYGMTADCTMDFELRLYCTCH